MPYEHHAPLIYDRTTPQTHMGTFPSIPLAWDSIYEIPTSFPHGEKKKRTLTSKKRSKRAAACRTSITHHGHNEEYTQYTSSTIGRPTWDTFRKSRFSSGSLQFMTHFRRTIDRILVTIRTSCFRAYKHNLPSQAWGRRQTNLVGLN